MISVADLFTTVTAQQTLTTWLNALESYNIPANSWRKGGVIRTALMVIATMYASFADTQVLFAQSGFLESASGNFLTLMAYWIYGVTRISATNASGSLVFTNTKGGSYSYAANTVTVYKSSSPSTLYKNVDAFTLAPMGTVTVTFAAVVAGSASSANAGEIDTLQVALPGVTVTNPLSFVGVDTQSDTDLRTTCEDARSAIAVQGPNGAYAYAIKTATRPDGSPVNINRVQFSSYSSTNQVSIYLASPSGAPTSDDVLACQTACTVIERDAVTSTVYAASEVDATASITVWALAQPGLLASDLATQVQSALTQFVSSYPLGGVKKFPAIQGYMYASALEGVVKSVSSAIFAIDGFTSDIPINDGQVLTLTTSVTVRLVSQ